MTTTPRYRRGFARSLWVSPLLALVLVAGVGAYRATLPGPESAEAFHARAAELVKNIPAKFGSWSGKDQVVQTEAIRLLRPNAIVSRYYVNEEDGRGVGFMFVQCKTVRDMAGHYPPNCYPNTGWSEVSHREIAWPMGEDREPAVAYEYLFESGFTHQVSQKYVINTIILPDGFVTPDYRRLNRQTSNYLARPFGAAQVQLVFSGEGYSPEERVTVAHEFAHQLREVVDFLSDAEELN